MESDCLKKNRRKKMERIKLFNQRDNVGTCAMK